MGWSGEKIAAIALWVVLATVVVGLTAYSHKHDEPCAGIECVQPVMVDPDAMPDTGASYTVKSPLSFDGLPGELNFVSLDMVLFTISQVQDGKFTVTLGPDYTWDEAGQEFWRLMEKFAAPNALIWKASP